MPHVPEYLAALVVLVAAVRYFSLCCNDSALLVGMNSSPWPLPRLLQNRLGIFLEMDGAGAHILLHRVVIVSILGRLRIALEDR